MIVHITSQLFYEASVQREIFTSLEKIEVTLFDIIHVSRSCGVHIFLFPFETSIIQF